MKNFVIERVETAQQVKIFHQVPCDIYRDDENWVQPLTSDIEHIFSPAHNPLFTVDGGGEAARWLLRDESGKAVGRIAAFYNKEKAMLEKQLTGGCGFFECPDDQDAANQLFDTARDWLSQRGMEAMDGPINFGDRLQWWGVLAEGFTMPLYAMPYNRPYYAALFEAYGFCNYFNQTTYLRPLVADIVMPEALRAKAERLYSNPDYSFQTFDKRQAAKMTSDFRTIYNRAWAKFEGVKPLSAEAADKIFRSMMPIIDSEVLYLAYHKGDPIGFFVMIPDLNQLIGKFHGRFGIVEKVRLMWGLKRKKVNRLSGLIFGVAPEFQGHGVEAAMIRQFEIYTFDRRDRRCDQYKTLELGWVGDFNPVMRRMCESYVKAVPHKRHVTYRYLFDRTLPFERCPRLK